MLLLSRSNVRALSALQKDGLGIARSVSKIVDVILKHFYWFKNQVASTRANGKYCAMSDRKFSRLDHSNKVTLLDSRIPTPNVKHFEVRCKAQNMRYPLQYTHAC